MSDSGKKSSRRPRADHATGSGLALKGMSEAQAAGKDANRGLPPVHLWNPEYCGELDIRIRRDGSWHYMGSPIGRKRLVRLFSTVLRRDEDGRFFLVTPVEKIGITVEDAPFVCVAMQVDGEDRKQVLTFVTNVGDKTIAGPEAPIRFETSAERGEPSPYVLVRGRLEALVNRAVFYDLVDLGCDEEVEGESWFGVWSSGVFFPFSRTAELATS